MSDILEPAAGGTEELWFKRSAALRAFQGRMQPDPGEGRELPVTRGGYASLPMPPFICMLTRVHLAACVASRTRGFLPAAIFFSSI